MKELKKKSMVKELAQFDNVRIKFVWCIFLKTCINSKSDNSLNVSFSLDWWIIQNLRIVWIRASFQVQAIFYSIQIKQYWTCKNWKNNFADNDLIFSMMVKCNSIWSILICQLLLPGNLSQNPDVPVHDLVSDTEDDTFKKQQKSSNNGVAFREYLCKNDDDTIIEEISDSKGNFDIQEYFLRKIAREEELTNENRSNWITLDHWKN